MCKERLAIALAIALAVGPLPATANATETRIQVSKQYQTQCSACHGKAGQGRQSLRAPPLAGQHADYLARQLRNFRDGIRVGASDDDPASTMQRIAGSLASDAEIAALAEFLSGLHTAAPKPSPSSAASASGRALFGVCMACHGARGEGNAALSAPRLSMLPRWYIATQLHAYRDGRRGADSSDRFGRQMRSVTSDALPHEDDIESVAAYVGRTSTPD